MVALPYDEPDEPVTALPMLTESVVSPKVIVWPDIPKSAVSVTVVPAVADEELTARELIWLLPIVVVVLIQTQAGASGAQGELP